MILLKFRNRKKICIHTLNSDSLVSNSFFIVKKRDIKKNILIIIQNELIIPTL